jgi:tetratricopeptide (TPR) repeat protein
MAPNDEDDQLGDSNMDVSIKDSPGTFVARGDITVEGDVTQNITGVPPEMHAKVLAELRHLRKQLDDAKVYAPKAEHPTWLANPTPEQKESAQSALDIFDGLIVLGVELTPWEQTRLARAAYLAGNGHLDELEKLYCDRLEIAQLKGDKEAIADAHGNLGYIASLRGDLEDAKHQYLQSLELEREIGDFKGAAVSLSNLGNLARLKETYEEAENYHKECISICKKHSNDRQYEAVSYGNLGNLARIQGNITEAERLHQESLDIKQEIGDLHGEATSQSSLGEIALLRGDYEAAQGYFRKYVRINHECGVPLYDWFENNGYTDPDEEWDFPPSEGDNP